jgi:hypothetical protein
VQIHTNPSNTALFNFFLTLTGLVNIGNVVQSVKSGKEQKLALQNKTKMEIKYMKHAKIGETFIK